MSQVKVEEQIGGIVLQLKGQFIGGEETDELRKVLKTVTELNKSKLIINMEKVTYLNSTALGVLISTHATMVKKGGRIILCNLAKSIENIFVITKLTLVFEISDNLDSAISSISE
jgi:anti-sigma B factor antagonist